MNSGSAFHRLSAVIMGATAFAVSDILSKVALGSGGGVMTISTLRGFVGAAMLYVWLRVGTRPAPLTRRDRWISLGVGILFTGNVYFLFESLDRVEVPIAIITYFTYPLFTGLAAAATRLEPLGVRGAIAAVAALAGLALMIGAHPGGLAFAGVGFAIAASLCRVLMLLITRATLGGADGRLITWYSILSSGALFILLSFVTQDWQPPQSAAGWAALIGIGATTTIGVLYVFISTQRIGPFRTALFMNLEPLLATIGSIAFLNETITPTQALGGAVMIGALVVFQSRQTFPALDHRAVPQSPKPKNEGPRR